RGETCYVVMNLYPYNPGHLLVCPYRHVPDYTDLNLKETAEFAQLTQIGMEVLGEVSHAAGFNLGMNQGKVGGAGIAAHLHQHIVPRWGGDGNFLPIIAQTKNVTGTIEQMRSSIVEAWNDVAQRFLHGQSRASDSSKTRQMSCASHPRNTTKPSYNRFMIYDALS